MKPHEELAALLDAFLDGELPEADAAEVRTHLAGCPACQAYVTDALAIRAAFPRWKDTVIPEGFVQSVLNALPPQKMEFSGGNPMRFFPSDHSAPRNQTRHWARTIPWRKVLPSLAACALLVLFVRSFGVFTPKGGSAPAGVNDAAPQDEAIESSLPSSTSPDAGTMYRAESAASPSDDRTDTGGAANGGGALTAPDAEEEKDAGGAASGDRFTGQNAAADKTGRGGEVPSASETGGALPPGPEAKALPEALEAAEAAPDAAADSGKPEEEEKKDPHYAIAILPREAAPFLSDYAPIPTENPSESGSWYGLSPDQYAALLDGLRGAGFEDIYPQPPEEGTVYVFLYA